MGYKQYYMNIFYPVRRTNVLTIQLPLTLVVGTTKMVSLRVIVMCRFFFIGLIPMILPGLPLFRGYWCKYELIKRVHLVDCTLVKCWLDSVPSYWYSFSYLSTPSASSEYLDANGNLVPASFFEQKYNRTNRCWAEP